MPPCSRAGTVRSVSGPRVYIHEFIDVIGHQRARYCHHMTANWGPIGREQRRQLCFGVWGVVGSTGAWPAVVNMWEYASWDDLAHNFAVELESPTMQDPALAEWWSVAADLRRGGFDRILVAPEWSPGVEQLCTRGVDAVAYAHELVGCRPGCAGELLESVRSVAVDAYAAHGLVLVGAFARAMAYDNECVLIWAIPDWQTWGRFEMTATGPRDPVVAWRRSLDASVTSWERILLVDAELAPLRTGRQPRVEDRRPLEDL